MELLDVFSSAKSMLGFGAPSRPPSALAELDAATSLSWKNRMIGFALCLGLGILFCFLATWSVLMPRTFAKFYTVGSLLIIGSTFFLMGPLKQMRSMFDSSRYISTIIYFGAIVGTLYAALVMHSVGLTLIMVIIQFCAALWYGASYVPFCQQFLMGTAKTVLPF